MGPRDAIARFAVPADPLTGEALSDAQLNRIDRIKAAADALALIMHECEGSDPGNPSFQSRRMAVANTQIELGLLMAYRACLESR
jgi:hypothetical protein